MSIIINIETSGHICSVAVTKDGMVDFQQEDTEGMKHAERLAPFLEKAMEHLRRQDLKPDAVAVSIGPGSYTGLRIGLSAAKGLAFSLDIPLIGIPTLKILAVKTMFRPDIELQGDELFIPMIDARRMEVFTAVYDLALNEMMSPRPLVLDENSFMEYDGRKILLMGDGASKCESLLKLKGKWIAGVELHARDMLALSEKALIEQNFIDVAYSVPEYLKEYQAIKSVNKVLNQQREE